MRQLRMSGEVVVSCRVGHYRGMGDPYLDGTCRWWHLQDPSPELLAASRDGWLGPAGVAVDLGCGLGTEAAFLAASGWAAIGLDLSAAAVHAAAASHARVTFLRADALALPLRDASADLLIDRGCFHYVDPADRPRSVLTRLMQDPQAAMRRWSCPRSPVGGRARPGPVT
jgi:SAM-dependent methyltransferase